MALSYWQKALALEPNSAALNAMLGSLHYIDARFSWWDDRETAKAKALSYAKRALELDPENSDANTTSSLALLLHEQFEDAAEYARRAAQLAPGSADVASFACFVLSFAGYSKEAVMHGERSMSLSPHRPAFYYGHLGNAYRLAGFLQEAITTFQAYHARRPGFGLADLVISYHQIGQPDEAKRIVEQLLAIRRDFTVSAWEKTQFRADAARLNADVAALRAAGLPIN